jgi:hypothetical protein
MTMPYPQQYTTFVKWADAVKLLRPDFEIDPQVHDESGWREWGNHLIQSKILAPIS